MPAITALPAIIDGLDHEMQQLCNRLFHVDTRQGELNLPSTMEDWADEQFDTDVSEQTIIRVKNSFTGDESFYNELRSSRPKVDEESEARQVIEESQGGPFCNPKEQTPADPFGRVEGEHCITASNVAKYDAKHGLVIFEDHDPLSFTEEEVQDYIGTAKQWFIQAEGRHEFLLWHCLWKSAASIVHGHMQLLSSKTPYSRVQEFEAVRQEYKDLHGADYFRDEFRVHDALGLATRVEGVPLYATLTPRKEKGLVVLHDRLDRSFASALYHGVSTLRDEWGVESFTVGVMLHPQEEFPVRAEIIDRGSLGERTTDVGAMELVAGASVIASDPFELVESL